MSSSSSSKWLTGRHLHRASPNTVRLSKIFHIFECRANDARVCPIKLTITITSHCKQNNGKVKRNGSPICIIHLFIWEIRALDGHLLIDWADVTELHAVNSSKVIAVLSIIIIILLPGALARVYFHIRDSPVDGDRARRI